MNTETRVLAGRFVFRLRDEQGFPLVFVFDWIKENNYVVEWGGFLDAAMKVWKVPKILAELEGAIKDAGWRGQPVVDFMEKTRMYIIWRIYTPEAV